MDGAQQITPLVVIPLEASGEEKRVEAEHTWLLEVPEKKRREVFDRERRRQCSGKNFLPKSQPQQKKNKTSFFFGGGGGWIVDVRRIRIKDVSKVSVFFRGRTSFGSRKKKSKGAFMVVATAIPHREK